MLKLGVNIDHVATLRQARYRGREEGDPSPVTAALEAEKAGAHGIKPVGLFNAILRAQVYRTLGNLAEGRAALDEADELNAEAQAAGFATAILAERCAHAALGGQWPEAHRRATAFVAARSYTTLPLLLPPQEFITEALMTGNDDGLAVGDARRWGGLVASIARFRIGHLRSLAVLAAPLARESSALNTSEFRASNANREQAITYLLEAATLAESLGLPGEVWQIQRTLGVLYRTTNRESEAQHCFKRASVVAGSLAAQMPDVRMRAAFVALAAGAIGPDARIALLS